MSDTGNKELAVPYDVSCDAHERRDPDCKHCTTLYQREYMRLWRKKNPGRRKGGKGVKVGFLNLKLRLDRTGYRTQELAELSKVPLSTIYNIINTGRCTKSIYAKVHRALVKMEDNPTIKDGMVYPQFKSVLKKLGVTQREFALMAGMSQAQVSRLARCIPVRRDTSIKLQKFFSRKVEEERLARIKAQEEYEEQLERERRIRASGVA